MSLKEISGAEELMRLALNGDKHVDALIGYYRDCIDQFNQQRALWATYYESSKNNVSDSYLLSSEIAKTGQKNRDLSSILALAKNSLTIQRQKYFRSLQNGNQVKKELEKTKKELRQITLQCKPIELHSKQSLRKQKQDPNSKRGQLELQLINLGKNHQEKKEKLLKNVQSLKRQLEDLMKQHQERIDTGGNQYLKALNNLANLQQNHIDLIIQFFRFRKDYAQQEEQIQQKNQMTRLNNIYIAQKLTKLLQAHSKQYHTVQAQVKKRNSEFKRKYDAQLKSKQQHLTLLKEQYQRIQDMHINKIKNMEEQLTNLNEKIKNISQKASIQINSLKGQIRVVKSRLQKQGLHQMKNQIVEDRINGIQQQDQQEEQSSSLQMSDLDNINNQVRNLQNHLNLN